MAKFQNLRSILAAEGFQTAGWERTPTMDDFKSDPEVGKLYGEYTFWLLHHDGSPRQRQMVKRLEQELTSKGFNQWGVRVDSWPPARDAYLRLVRKNGIEPEAVRAASAKVGFGWDDDAIIDFFDQNPEVTLRELARMTGRTVVELKRLLMGSRAASLSDEEVDAQLYEAERMRASIGKKLHDHLDFLKGEVRAHRQTMKSIERAWDKWDYRALEALGMISREESKFLRDVRANYSEYGY
jgi:hypothetical protein